MNRDIAKGALILALAAAVFALFLLIAGSGPDKAACIARALRGGVAVGNIERVCNLLAKP
ncbi:hypothetical protein [Janthinobacterium sp.]|uniref:hypothetical protein n=1 Tax=Janthinobacterium sp. TaxID=1871054 RepID=UPI00293D660D|nr:hypothetical protein [Janthinobacterium sp.]